MLKKTIISISSLVNTFSKKNSKRSNIELHPKFLRNTNILSENYGQLRSIQESESVDRGGYPIPWITYPCLEYLNCIDVREFLVFEYGSGNSTLYWSRRALKVISVEHDVSWFNQVSEKLLKNGYSNCEYQLKTSREEYVANNIISSADIVVIDGEFRPYCAKYLLEIIKNNNHKIKFLVFDNADWFPKTIEYFVASSGWLQVDFSGFGPINDYTSTTSIFFNPDNISQVKRLRSLHSAGGISHIAAFDDIFQDNPAPVP